MNTQKCLVDDSAPVTLKEVIRARSSLVRQTDFHWFEPPVPSLESWTAQPSLESQLCLQRKFPRFSPRHKLYVLHRELGRVVNLGMGGLCFTYFDDPNRQSPLPQEGLLVTADNHYLEGLPFEVIADLVVIPHYHGKYRVRKRCVRFGELEDEQVEKLENFILENAHIPQLSTKIARS